MVVAEGVAGGWVGRRGVSAGPVVGDFVVVERVEPREGVEKGERP